MRAKTWLIRNSRDKKKVFLIVKNLYNSKLKKIANILLKELVLLLLA
jgi:hypothetical protein